MTLLEKYIIARWCYAIGEDYIDDVEYKYVEEKLKESAVQSEYIGRSWSNDPCPVALLEKYNIMHLYRDIKFIHQSESIESLDSMEIVEARVGNLKESSRVSIKEDGFNIQVNYYNGHKVSADTRGRTGNALNANVVLKLLPDTVPYSGKVKVTGEVVIPNAKWPRYMLETGNAVQRNSVRTALANGDLEYLEFVAFNIQADSEQIEGDKYKILKTLGFKTPISMFVSSYPQLLAAIEFLGKRKKVLPYPSDGLVLENSQVQLALRVGVWEETSYISYVIEYIERTGMFSNAINVGIRPVKTEIGSVARQVSVVNIQAILNNNLKIGAPIAFDLRSAADIVINTTLTDEVQKKWEGRYPEFKALIDQRNKETQ